MHNSLDKSKGYMPVSSGPNMTGFDMGKTSSMMDMMQEGGLTPMSSYQRSFTRPRTPGAALLARALQKQEDLSLLEDYQRAEAERQKKGGLFGSIGGLAGGLLGAALAPVTGGASLPLFTGLGTALGKRAGEGLGAGKSRSVDRTGTVFGQQSFRDIEQASRDYTRGMGERALVSGLQAGLMAGLTPGGGIYGKVAGRLRPDELISGGTALGVVPAPALSQPPSLGLETLPSAPDLTSGGLTQGPRTLIDSISTSLKTDSPIVGTGDFVLSEASRISSIPDKILVGAGTDITSNVEAVKSLIESQKSLEQSAEIFNRIANSPYYQEVMGGGGDQLSFVPFGRNAGLPFGSFEDGGLIGMQTGGLTAEQILRDQGLTADDTQLALFQAFDPTEIQSATQATGESLLGMTGGQGLASAGSGFGSQQRAVTQAVGQAQQSLEGQIEAEKRGFESQTLGTAADIVAGGGEFGTYGGSGTTTAQTEGGGTTTIPNAPSNPEDGDLYTWNNVTYEWSESAGQWFEVTQG